MRITITLLTLFVVGALSAQTADITTGCVPLSVKFTPPSSATTFFWTFKDGGTSNLASPTNIFTTPGTYSVEFRTTTNGPIVGKVNITVYPKPVVGITAVPESGCIPLSVKFNDTTSLAGDIQVLSYSWVFGDGGNGSGSGPIHIYNTVGAFSVSVELLTNYSTCNVTQVFPDIIHTGVKPLVSFSTTPSPATACDPPLNVSFNNTTVGGAGNLSYSWNFGNGNTSGQPNPPAQTYTQTASYTVTLTATDAFGCSATATAPVVIGNPIAAFLTPDTVCVGDSLIFENTSSFGAYNWTFGPDAKPAASTDLDGGTVFSTPGLKTVTLTVTRGSGCSTTETKQIFADLADATFIVSPTYSCSDPTLFSPNPSSTAGTQWSWTFSDKSSSTAKNPVYKWVTP
ncbi:MAG: PKD domain-containing protein, partial [Saprospiraceae bacterium]|nr:PKD domain-containing protein [Saprospiraceae bacterium]